MQATHREFRRCAIELAGDKTALVAQIAGWQWLARPSPLTGAATLVCYVADGPSSHRRW